MTGSIHQLEMTDIQTQYWLIYVQVSGWGSCPAPRASSLQFNILTHTFKHRFWVVIGFDILGWFKKKFQYVVWKSQRIQNCRNVLYKDPVTEQGGLVSYHINMQPSDTIIGCLSCSFRDNDGLPDATNTSLRWAWHASSLMQSLQSLEALQNRPGALHCVGILAETGILHGLNESIASQRNGLRMNNAVLWLSSASSVWTWYRTSFALFAVLLDPWWYGSSTQLSMVPVPFSTLCQYNYTFP